MGAEVEDAGGLGIGYMMGKFDGIMGLAFEALSLGGATTVFKNAIDQGAVNKPIFAFKLGDNADGELTFGGYDDSKFKGDISWVSLSEPKYWEIKVDDVQIGSYSLVPSTALLTLAPPSSRVHPLKSEKLLVLSGRQPTFLVSTPFLVTRSPPFPTWSLSLVAKRGLCLGRSWSWRLLVHAFLG